MLGEVGNVEPLAVDEHFVDVEKSDAREVNEFRHELLGENRRVMRDANALDFLLGRHERV